jgi:hypothetical protein
VENWQLVGNYQPSAKVADKLKYFSRQVFEVFKNENL